MAHGVAPKHEIFQKPFPVNLELKKIPMPDDYRITAKSNSLPNNLDAWQVQFKGYSEASSGVGPGLVSSGKGFLDSPDTEIMSSGINSKSIDAVAIGRQGSFLLWGFDGVPSNLTESGQMALLNSVVYISKFDRTPVLARKLYPARGYAIDWALYAQNYPSIHDKNLETARKHNQRVREVKEAAKTRKLTPEEEQIARMPFWDEDTLDQAQEKLYKQLFPPEVLATTGQNGKAVVEFYQANVDYLTYNGNAFTVDEDVKALGIPNNDLRLLNRCIEQLEQNKDTDRALRVLKRYTGLGYKSAPEWKSWLSANRNYLFFSDGMQRFLSKAPLQERLKREMLAKKVDTPTAAAPIVWDARLVQDGNVYAGDSVMLVVRLKLAPTWHVYASAPEGSPYMVTDFEVKLPEGMQFEGEWLRPQAKPFDEGTTIYEGDLVFMRKVRAGRNVTGAVKLPLAISYQTCDHSKCLPPDTADFELPLTVRKQSRFRMYADPT